MHSCGITRTCVAFSEEACVEPPASFLSFTPPALLSPPCAAPDNTLLPSALPSSVLMTQPAIIIPICVPGSNHLPPDDTGRAFLTAVIGRGRRWAGQGTTEGRGNECENDCLKKREPLMEERRTPTCGKETKVEADERLWGGVAMVTSVEEEGEAASWWWGDGGGREGERWRGDEEEDENKQREPGKDDHMWTCRLHTHTHTHTHMWQHHIWVFEKRAIKCFCSSLTLRLAVESRVLEMIKH